MKRRGRPPFPPGVRKNAQLFIRVTEREESQLEAHAKAMGLTVSECVRLYVFSMLEGRAA
jgi:antitoxin component of RelBE/YafQ-DinJ toxin-antitoxin module